MRTVTFLPTLVLEPLVWILFDEPKAESFGHIRLETLVVVVDGCLTSDDWFAFGGIGLFFPDEKVKLIDMLQGYIIKSLELSEAFKCFVFCMWSNALSEYHHGAGGC